MESVTYKNLNFNVWVSTPSLLLRSPLPQSNIPAGKQDLGGQTSIRPYWRCYYANTAAVIFVVDSTDIERLNIASEELAAMLNEEELRDAALLVFANKQDQPGSKGAGEISEALNLGELRDRNWSIVACSAVDGRGINEGMDWLVVSGPVAVRGVVERSLLMTGCDSKQCSQNPDVYYTHLQFSIFRHLSFSSGINDKLLEMITHFPNIARQHGIHALQNEHLRR